MKIGLYSRLSVISTFIFCASLACQSIIPLEPERPHSEDSGSYSFDEATIFRSLAQGNSIEFTLILENWIVPTPTSNHNQRSFKDFFDLAQAFHQWKWKETMMSWNLFELQYQVNCTTVDRGPSLHRNEDI